MQGLHSIYQTPKVLIEAFSIAFLEKLNLMYNLNIEYSTSKAADKEEVAEIMNKFDVPLDYEPLISTLSNFLRGRPKKQKNDVYQLVSKSWIKPLKSLKALKRESEINNLLDYFSRKTGFRMNLDVNGNVGAISRAIEKSYSEDRSFLAAQKTFFVKVKLAWELSTALGEMRRSLEFGRKVC